MYLPRQVVWNFDTKRPFKIGPDVWNMDSYPTGNRTTNFEVTEVAPVWFLRQHSLFYGISEHRNSVWIGKTVKEALKLLKKGWIRPSIPCGCGITLDLCSHEIEKSIAIRKRLKEINGVEAQKFRQVRRRDGNEHNHLEVHT